MEVNNCSYWRPKVNDKFYSLWSNSFGKTQPHWQWSKILKIMVWRMQTWKYWTKILKISESHISETSATMYLPIQAIWGHSGERSDKCNQCHQCGFCLGGAEQSSWGPPYSGGGHSYDPAEALNSGGWRVPQPPAPGNHCATRVGQAQVCGKGRSWRLAQRPAKQASRTSPKEDRVHHRHQVQAGIACL